MGIWKKSNAQSILGEHQGKGLQIPRQNPPDVSPFIFGELNHEYVKRKHYDRRRLEKRVTEVEFVK